MFFCCSFVNFSTVKENSTTCFYPFIWILKGKSLLFWQLHCLPEVLIAVSNCFSMSSCHTHSAADTKLMIEMPYCSCSALSDPVLLTEVRYCDTVLPLPRDWSLTFPVSSRCMLGYASASFNSKQHMLWKVTRGAAVGTFVLPDGRILLSFSGDMTGCLKAVIKKLVKSFKEWDADHTDGASENNLV